MQEIGSQMSNTNACNGKTYFQYVSISLLLKMEVVGLMVLFTSFCVMNHALNVLFCSFPAWLVFMITIALLNSYSESSYALLWFFMYEFVSVWCWLVAALCSAWMLHLLQFDCFSENTFPGILAEKPISMHNHASLLRDYWILTFFFTIPWRAILLCYEYLWFVWGKQMVF